MGDWIAFWDSDNPIYVDARHRDVHYRTVADDIRAYVPGPDAVVLDYGCGEALHADRVAAVAGRLLLSDAAPTVRQHLAARFAGRDDITVYDPAAVAALPDRSLDLIVMVSVAQYLSREALDDLLRLFRRLLREDGRLVLADVVPPDASPLTDAAALLRFAARHGFLFAAIKGLMRTALSDYRKLRTSLGLSLYTEADMRACLAAAGFEASRAPRNVGHNHARMTFVAFPAATASA